MSYVSPLRPLIVTSRFGPRPPPDGDMHPGVDMRCMLAQDVHAVAAGEVVDSRFSANNPVDWSPGKPKPKVMGYGNIVIIAHDDGTTTRYAHLSRRLVEAGEHVEAGQVIGLAGSTGYSFGVHLHFEVRVNGGRSAVDPLPYLEHLSPAVIGAPHA